MSACLATCLAGCVTSEGPNGAAVRVTLPPPPEGVAECLRASFPEIPDRALSRSDVLRIIGEAKLQDRAKTACGLRAVTWIDRVSRDLAR